jgi:hypothetical protein
VARSIRLGFRTYLLFFVKQCRAPTGTVHCTEPRFFIFILRFGILIAPTETKESNVRCGCHQNAPYVAGRFTVEACWLESTVSVWPSATFGGYTLQLPLSSGGHVQVQAMPSAPQMHRFSASSLNIHTYILLVLRISQLTSDLPHSYQE